MPQQKGSRSSSSKVLSALTKALPVIRGAILPAARSSQVKEPFGIEPQAYKYSEQMLANPAIDGVMIGTGDHQHAKLCIEVVAAGEDCYVEKPFANVLSEAKAARAAVKSSKQVVQMGTQHRSQPYPLAVRDLIRSGRIGEVVKITQEWNVNQPRWRKPKSKAVVTEQDTDWKRWLLGKPYRPFDPLVYQEFLLIKISRPASSISGSVMRATWCISGRKKRIR